MIKKDNDRVVTYDPKTEFILTAAIQLKLKMFMMLELIINY